MLHHTRRAEVLKWDDGPGPQAGLELRRAARRGVDLEPAVKIPLLSKRDESHRLAGGYPEEDDDIMPTRLGNVLRRYERLAGYQYKLDAVRVVRHIAFVAPRPHVDYLNDQRQLLDLSVRMCATSIVAVFVAIAFLWHHGPWLMIALVPYAIAYLSYRGAVVVAHEYGDAICTLIDLDRFALYDYLRMPRPENAEAEQCMNVKLMEFIGRHNPNVALSYDHSNAQQSFGFDGSVEVTQSGT
jgi:hypothetical protein